MVGDLCFVMHIIMTVMYVPKGVLAAMASFHLDQLMISEKNDLV